MFTLKIEFRGKLVTLGQFPSADDAHWAAAEWRQKFGRPTSQGDPFRVTEVRRIEAEPFDADMQIIATIPAL